MSKEGLWITLTDGAFGARNRDRLFIFRTGENMFDPKDGLIVVLTGKRAVGKSTLQASLLRHLPGSAKVVTYTTRPPEVRDGKQDVNGQDYHFVSKEEFLKLRKRRKLFEWSKRGKYYYGSSKGDIAEQLKKHPVVLMAIDPKGAMSYKQVFGDRAFVVALWASEEELKRRLCDRQKLSQGEIEKILSDGKIDDKKWLNQAALTGEKKAKKQSLSKKKIVDFPVHNEHGNIDVIAMRITQAVRMYPYCPKTVQ